VDDLEAFARLVTALRPWLGQLVVVGGWAQRLQALAGDRKGQHSIRIDDRFRICFVWKDGEAQDVEVVDYH
jgi:plasmid maintenance system killer protein